MTGFSSLGDLSLYVTRRKQKACHCLLLHLRQKKMSTLLSTAITMHLTRHFSLPYFPHRPLYLYGEKYMLHV